MSLDIPLPLVISRPRRDYYNEFIEGSRWLHREQASARTEWFENLELEKKEQYFFEFEMMLKGLVCFGNPVNHPGPPKRGDSPAVRAFKNELSISRTIVKRIIKTGQKLSSSHKKKVVFQRYLESVIAKDETRFQMVKQSFYQDTPAESLSVLISAFENILEMVDGLVTAPYVSYRLFSSMIQMAQREIHRSTYFNPLAALEFRVEFDKIYPEEMLVLTRKIRSDPARRVAALTFLALFRLLSYIETINEIGRRGSNLEVLFGWLAVLRSDARALTIFLNRDSTAWISTGFGNLFENHNPEYINENFNKFESEFKGLKTLVKLLASVGDQLRLEQRKVFEQQLPGIDSIGGLEHFGKSCEAAMGPLRAFLQNTILLLAREFEPTLNGSTMFDNFVLAAVHSERLRRDIWMFQRILRAFIQKAKSSASSADQWSRSESFGFIRQFVKYFKSMGYLLLRYSDYNEFDKFINRIDRLQEGDVLEVQRFSEIIVSCEGFQQFLEHTFESVSNREELKGVQFNRKEAAHTLKLFLKR